MKNFYLILVTFSILIVAIWLNACKKDNNSPTQNTPTQQNLASTQPENKTVVIESYFGVRSGYGPDGLRIAKAYEDANPGKVITISVHSGDDAAPWGWPWLDLTTTFGTHLLSESAVKNYPGGVINRHLFTQPITTQAPGGLAIDRTNWSIAGDQIKNDPAPVNVGLSATWDSATRTISVKTETYYTANETVANNLNVAVIENNIVGYQKDNSSTPNPNPKYVENNVLRSYITPEWGATISSTTKGSTNDNTYFWSVPTTMNPHNLYLVAFVSRGHKEILNAKKIKLLP